MGPGQLWIPVINRHTSTVGLTYWREMKSVIEKRSIWQSAEHGWRDGEKKERN